jgi:hypothetical protein
MFIAFCFASEKIEKNKVQALESYLEKFASNVVKAVANYIYAKHQTVRNEIEISDFRANLANI